MAVESGNEQMVIVACDLGSISCQLNDLVKAKIAESKIINPNKVILRAIHTHTSYTIPALSILAKKMAGGVVERR